MEEHDLEKGLGSNSSSPSPGEEHKVPTHAPLQSRNPHFRSELEIFQGLVGIHYLKEGGEPNPDANKNEPSVSPLMATFFPSKTTKARQRNRGIYNRAVTQDLKNRSLYTISRYVISGLYLLQVLVAATFTALSLRRSPHHPRRNQHRHRRPPRLSPGTEIRSDKLYQLQRPDPVVERDRIVKMFEEAGKDQEANYPETTQTPMSDQMEVKNGELRDEASKWKTKKKEQEKEMIRLKEELEEARTAVKAGLKGGREVMQEVVGKI